MTVAEFLERYPTRTPRRKGENPDELRLLTTTEGVKQLAPPPFDADERCVPAHKGDNGCHLWALDARGIPYILERALVVPPLESGVVKHTNLTGGKPAACGGEVWFDPAVDDQLYVNGCSGRYGPTSERQLEDSVDVFRSLGYQVESFGWDADANKPAMVLR